MRSGGTATLPAATGLAPATRLLAALALMTAASQFHRAALGVVGPELAAALGAGTGLLGAANGAFFLALLLLQVPVGLALDRIGPRRTVAWLALPAALGALGQALAPDAGWFLAARFLLGIGCAASFMASVVLCARWHAGPGLTTALARVFALSQGGILLAGAPFAALAGVLGWRGAYALSGAATLALAALWWAWVRDDPPDRPPPHRPAETLGEALLGQVTVWRTPGLLPVLCMHLVGYAAMATVLAVWAGPYLSEVHGLEPGPRGAVLFGMGLALVAGLLGVGPLERRLNTRKWLVAALSGGAALVLLALTLWPQPPLAAAVALLTGLCLLSCYPVVVVAHGRSLFPDHLVGRGATTVNLAQTLGSAALPALTGWAVAVAPRGEAWPIAFGTLALALLLGLGGYLAGRDVPPRR
ncbi:MFS transporter [Paracraurococcus lichenis]|uniref:MFS transporter n=1 Tax=Paracraurococcus lichenis TaxID=3064888 RepID=A0ABT9DVU6_9PROT|nr:MFS transporter [Paracraurococcus sp. LOR1-02]MDO9708021.1 MFS transporter [Paracraurococcus sp. LOR1-02]